MSYTDRLNKFLKIHPKEESARNALPIRRNEQIYYYIVAAPTALSNGRTFTDGPYSDEDEARQVAFNTVNGDFQIVTSRQGTLKGFNQEKRHDVLVETGDVNATFKNFTHKPYDGG